MRRCTLLVNSQHDLDPFLRLVFRPAGHRVFVARSHLAALLALVRQRPDLVLANLTRSDAKGAALVRMAHWFDIPVLVLLPRPDVGGAEYALAVDADDYVSAPFRLEELRLRADALMRIGEKCKSGYAATSAASPSGPTRRAARQNGAALGRTTRLGPVEFSIVSWLAESGATQVERSQIIASAWGEGIREGNHLLDFTLARLQAKIGFDPSLVRLPVLEENRALFTAAGLAPFGGEVGRE
ncbi:MAG: response regulator transcription factor [Rudaea sp.]